MSWKFGVNVVIGIIVNSKNQLFISQRAYDRDHGGLWEFPGGKVESYETCEEAIIREIKEEVGLIVKNPQFLKTIIHEYPGKCVHLHAYLINDFEGVPRCYDNQLDCRWINKDELNQFQFPEANAEIITDLIEFHKTYGCP